MVSFVNVHQTFWEEITLVSNNLFQKTEEEGTLPNSSSFWYFLCFWLLAYAQISWNLGVFDNFGICRPHSPSLHPSPDVQDTWKGLGKCLVTIAERVHESESQLRCHLFWEVLLIIPLNVTPFQLDFLLNTYHQQKLSHLYVPLPVFLRCLELHWELSEAEAGYVLATAASSAVWAVLSSTAATGHMCLISSCNVAAGIEMCCGCNRTLDFEALTWKHVNIIYAYIHIYMCIYVYLNNCENTQ